MTAALQAAQSAAALELSSEGDRAREPLGSFPGHQSPRAGSVPGLGLHCCVRCCCAAFGRAKPLSFPLTFALHGVRSLLPPQPVGFFLHCPSFALLEGFCLLPPSLLPSQGTEAVPYPTAGTARLLSWHLSYCWLKSPTGVGEGKVLTWDTNDQLLSYALCFKKKKLNTF